MAERSTIYEVARSSGVSTATVSRVMHNSTGYSPATRERVLTAAADLGWVPSGSARGLAIRRAGIIGLLFPDFTSMGEAEEESPLYVDQVIRGAERAATAAGDAVLIAATRGTTGRDLAWSVAGKVDGLVVVARSLTQADLHSIARNLPITLLAHRGSRRANFDTVSVDNRSGVRALVEHLVTDHGCRDIVFVGGPARSPDSMERFAGFREALRGAGLPAPRSPHAEGAFTEAGGAHAVRALLVDRRHPDAIVCGNDEMAIGALAVLAIAKLRVPADVAVTGFDDIAAGRHIRPSLTTVRQPMRELGEQGVHSVLTRIGDPERRRLNAVLPTELVLRRSCGCRSAKPASTSARPAA